MYETVHVILRCSLSHPMASLHLALLLSLLLQDILLRVSGYSSPYLAGSSSSDIEREVWLRVSFDTFPLSRTVHSTTRGPSAMVCTQYALDSIDVRQSNSVAICIRPLLPYLRHVTFLPYLGNMLHTSHKTQRYSNDVCLHSFTIREGIHISHFYVVRVLDSLYVYQPIIMHASISLLLQSWVTGTDVNNNAPSAISLYTAHAGCVCAVVESLLHSPCLTASTRCSDDALSKGRVGVRSGIAQLGEEGMAALRRWGMHIQSFAPPVSVAVSCVDGDSGALLCCDDDARWNSSAQEEGGREGEQEENEVVIHAQ